MLNFNIALILALVLGCKNAAIIDKLPSVKGNWVSCGIKKIEVNDTVTFEGDVPFCQTDNCLNLRWKLGKKGNFKSGWQTGCEDTKVGYGLKNKYKWKFDSSNSLLKITIKDSEEVYMVLNVTNNILKVSRIK